MPEKPRRMPQDLSREELVEIVSDIQQRMYCVAWDDENKPCDWDFDNEVNGADLVEFVGDTLHMHGLVPPDMMECPDCHGDEPEPSELLGTTTCGTCAGSGRVPLAEGGS